MDFTTLPILMSLLSTLALNPTPWSVWEAGSEQRHPLYLGASPRAMVLHKQKKKDLTLPKFLKAEGEKQFKIIRKLLKKKTVQFETWPTINDDGYWTWAIVRYREKKKDPWAWIWGSEFWDDIPEDLELWPELPVTFRMWNKEEKKAVFQDFMKHRSLYTKPRFGDCVWTDRDGKKSYGAWFPTKLRVKFSKTKLPLVCHAISQPPRFNLKPLSFVVTVDSKGVHWPEGIDWYRYKKQKFKGVVGNSRIQKWPSNFSKLYRKDVEFLAGKTFVKKNNAEKNHDLERMVDYLEKWYKKLGIKTKRQTFKWRGQKHSNLVAIIPGSEKDAAPVLMADHIDTAFSEDKCPEKAEEDPTVPCKRVSTAGADDNVTAVAALLRAAEVLKDSKPKRPIWLVHLTGEEFPADCLGARKFVPWLLRTKRDISGLVLLDMIGYNKPKDRIFQISVGRSKSSAKLAQVALNSSVSMSKKYKPIVRPFHDKKSYLYNTDGLIFSDAGYPVILFNEHLNATKNLLRRHYHETTDTPRHIDWKYAVNITKAAIETVARVSGIAVIK